MTLRTPIIHYSYAVYSKREFHLPQRLICEALLFYDVGQKIQDQRQNDVKIAYLCLITAFLGCLTLIYTASADLYYASSKKNLNVDQNKYPNVLNIVNLPLKKPRDLVDNILAN